MDKIKENGLEIRPVTSYVAPGYPTRTECDSSMLKKLPTRWQKKAAIVAGVGALSVSTLTGCNLQAVFHLAHILGQGGGTGGGNDTDCCCDNWIHHGGAGEAPIYVVHMTEQEALSIIRNQAEQAGLNLSDVPPHYGSVEVDGKTIWIDLFDEDRRVAIVYLDAEYWIWWHWNSMDEFAQQVADSLVEEIEKYLELLGLDLTDETIHVGVFYAKGTDVWSRNDISEERKAVVEAHLAEQVDLFMEELREAGVLD